MIYLFVCNSLGTCNEMLQNRALEMQEFRKLGQFFFVYFCRFACTEMAMLIEKLALLLTQLAGYCSLRLSSQPASGLNSLGMRCSCTASEHHSIRGTQICVHHFSLSV